MPTEAPPTASPADHMTGSTQNGHVRLDCGTVAHAASDAPAYTGSVGEVSLSAEVSATPAQPKRIGEFIVEDELGRGGMGTVYRATQLRPVRRTVALKVIRPEALGPGALERFLAERQTLARLNHTDIAKLLDAGSHANQPFFAMEYAEGQTLEAYAKSHCLPISERVRLVARFARAIEHAHQCGVLHRDIKPENVLVSGPPQNPTMKVIDFGIAKDAANGLATETAAGEVLGTPAFMAPEQVSGDADARSDVYALGATLFRLLTDHNVIEFAHNAGLAEMLSRVSQHEAPSLQRTAGRLSAQKRSQLAFERQTTPRRLQKALRGELDLVLMQALSFDRLRRYATAGDFADDLDRYLAQQPVRAARPTLRYRAAKFIRRNRATVVATASVVAGVAIIGSIAAYREHQAQVEQQRRDIAIATERAEQLRRQQRLETESRLRAERIARDIDRELAVAEDALSAPSESRLLWNNERQHASRALDRANTLLAQYPADGPDHLDLTARYERLSRVSDRSQRSADFAEALREARDHGTGGNAYGMPLAEQADKSCIENLRGVFAGVGIDIASAAIQGTTPSDAAAQLRNIAHPLREDVIDALDFIVSRSRRGIGVIAERDDTGLIVRRTLPNFTTDADIYESDHIVGLQQSGSDNPIDVTSWTVDRLNSIIFGEPGTQVTLLIESEIRDNYRVTATRDGHEADWALQVLKRLDRSTRRTRQREAIFTSNRSTLCEIANEATIRTERPLTLVQLAQALEDVGEPSRAVALLRTAHEAYPGDFWTNLVLSNSISLAGGDTSESTRFLTAAAAIRPNSVPVNTRLAMTLAMSRNQPAAISQMKRVMSLAPQNYVIRRVLITYLRKAGRYEEALPYQEELVDMFPGKAQGFCDLGYLAGRTGNVAAELAHYEKASELAPSDPSYRYRLIAALRAQNQPANAAKHVRRVLKSEKPDYEYIYYLQTTLQDDEPPEIPAIQMRKIIENDPTPFDWHRSHGYVFLASGDPWAASAALAEALRLRPDDQQVQRWLAQAKRDEY